MAITFRQLAAITASTSNTNSYASGAAGTPNAGDLLIGVAVGADTVAAGGFSGGGFTWSKLTSFTFNAGADTIYVFYAYADSATSTTTTFTCTGDNATGAILYCIRLSGHYGVKTPSIRQFKTATGSAANPSLTMDYSILSGNGLLGVACNKTNSSTQWTAPGSWSEMAEGAFNTPATSMQVSRASGITGTSVAWTNSNTTNWGIIVLEIWDDPIYKSISGGASYNSPMFY